jgi:hypothetical protein
VSRFGKGNATTLCAAAGVLVSACIVVSPLEDFPDPPGAAGRAGSAGGNGSGGSKAGQGGAGGTSGAGGDAGAGAVSGRGGNGGSGGGSGGSGGDSGAGASGDAGEAGSAGSEGCSTNRECVIANHSDPARCRPSDRRCVPLLTSECPLVYPDVEDVYSDPDALYIGGFATLAPVRYDENSVVWAQRLAIEELSGDNVNGLPGVDGGRRRPLVMIVCNNDTATDADTIDRGMRHLTDELEVQALVATLKPGDLVRAFENHHKGKVFFLDPVSATSIVGNYDDDDLIWTMLGPPKDYAPAYRELLELTEAYLRRTRITDLTAKIKVAHVTSTDAFNEELKNFVEPMLRFNGDLDVTQNGAEHYLSVTVNTELEPEEKATQIFDLAAQVRAFRPDVVISTAGPEFSQARGVLEYIETLWDDGTNTPRPFILLSPYNAGNTAPVVDLIEAEMTVVGGGQAADPDAYKRFVGLSGAGAEDPTLQNQYASRLTGKFGTGANPDTGNYYDAVYFLAYSMVASGASVPTAPQIAKGMRRLIAGDRFDVGPTPIADVFDVLSEPETSIELYGTLGPPDFDAGSGVRIGTSSAFCFFKSSAFTVVPRIDVLRYDRDSAQFVGNFPCFDFMPP